MDATATVELTGLSVTVIGAIIAGSMRFGSMENRIDTLESLGQSVIPKVDKIAESLARIEGRIEQVEIWKK